MSFLQGLAGPLAGGLGGAISPASGLGMAGGPMSGLGALGSLFGKGGGGGYNPLLGILGSALFGGKGGGEGGSSEGSSPAPAQPAPAAPPAPTANAAATGLGRLIGVDPGKISAIAKSVGEGMNQVAAGGGAQPGYAAPQPALPTVNNHMQLLDPKILQALIAHFSGGQRP